MSDTLTIYTPASPLQEPRKLARRMLHDLVASRDLALSLFIRDISAQYRQSMLGYLWLFIPPLLASIPFIYLQAEGIFRVGGTGVAYPAYAVVGTIVWQVFVDALNAPLKAFAGARAMLTRINLPLEAILLSALAQVGFGSFIRLVLLAGIFGWFHIVPPPTALLLPLGILSLILIGFVIGVLLTPLGLLYSDVQQTLPIATTFLMLLTPVVYPPPVSGFVARVAAFNPLTALVATTRDWLLVGPSPHLNAFIVVTTMTMALLLLGWVVFRVALPHLISRVGA
jgi:lipopolysaccharide transport system permease protein